VRITLTAEDALGQTGTSGAEAVVLPGRRFFDPLAAAIVEQRRDLLWNRGMRRASRRCCAPSATGPRTSSAPRRCSSSSAWRSAGSRPGSRYDQMTDTLRRRDAEALWAIALEIEEGDLSDALERLRRAQEQLAEAMRNGATDEEIAALMQELREAMQDYMQQLAEQGPQDNQQMSDMQDMQEITPDQLEQMLQQLQELMEQGRMDEAQALLDQLRQMMENMQMAEGQPGQGQQSPGQQAMEGLAETLRQQQGLSDETFGDLQQQFGQGEQQGQSPGPGPAGPAGAGRRRRPAARQPGQGQGPGEPGNLAQRQQALRDELARQQGQLPGAGTPEGDAAREALDRAGRAMDRPRSRCGRTISPARSTTSRTRWRRSAKACASWASRWRSSRASRASRARRWGRPTRWASATRWAGRPARTAASAPTSSFCRARTCIAGPRSFWTRSAAAPATSRARSEERDYLNRLLDRF
jgi:hypothetical protein